MKRKLQRILWQNKVPVKTSSKCASKRKFISQSKTMTRLRQCEWWLSNRRGMKQKCKMRIFKLLCWKKWINSDRNSNKVYRLYSNAFNATERSRSNIDRSIHKDSSKEIKTCCRIFLKNKQLNNEEPKISLNLRLVNVRKNLRMSLRDKFRRKNIIQTQKSTCPVFSER